MVTRRPRRRKDGGSQIPTQPVSAAWIMSQPSFALGVTDVRAGRRIHRDYDLWDTNGQWSYERGRVWATLAPRNVQLRRAGKITPEALAWFKSFSDDII